MKNIKFSEMGISIDNLKDYIQKMKIRVVFFSETHRMIPETVIQKKIIEKISPDYFLYELLEEEEILRGEYDKFLERNDSEDFSIISKVSDLKPTVEIAKKLNIPLIGCDIKDMLRINTKFRERENLTPNEIEEENNIMKKREERQIKSINKILGKKPKVLVFVSLGAYHLRKNSPVFKAIKSEYVLIRPLFNGKEIYEVDNPLACNVSYIITGSKPWQIN